MSLTTDFPPSLWPIRHPEQIESPQLVVFLDHLRHNLSTMIRMAGSDGTRRLRPHCKTHKMPAVTQLQLELGITKHKAATIAEAEMLAQAGAQDVLLAYNIVGPNLARIVRFRQTYPEVKLAVTADDLALASQLSDALSAAEESVHVLMDVNPGRDRTGLVPDADARGFYQQLARFPGLQVDGFHIYDGHFHQTELAERIAAVRPAWEQVLQLRDQLEAAGCLVPRLVCGGTPTFPVFAQFSEPTLELSPGTCVFHDASYHEKYPDLREFRPAALVLTRVISRPTTNRVTFDLGTKAIASDPPMGQRAWFPGLPEGTQMLHNEEHLVIETPDAARWHPGDWALAIPRHVCPTSALYRQAVVLEAGEIVDQWPVVGRDRKLTI